MTSNADSYTRRMNGTAPALGISNVGRTSCCYKSEEESQAINESVSCSAKGTLQLLLEEKQAIMRREGGLKSGTERVVIALNALTPIKRLPDDVLCHIFELHCESSLPVTLPLHRPVWSKPPQITISHVCSAWREIMLDIPTFWNNIRVVPMYLDTGRPRTFDFMVKLANTWLSRAKGLPCSIEIDSPYDDKAWYKCRPLWEMDWHKNIVKDLISLHRFKKLRVTFADHHLRDLLQLPDDKLSCVEDLRLRYICLANSANSAWPLDLHKLSNLTSFSHLHNPFPFYSESLSDPLEGYSKFVDIPWHNLRHIDFRTTIPAPFCLDALEHSSAVLETCSLVITGDHTFTSSPRVPFHLFQLRNLEVVVCSLFREEDILEFFLLSLRFPNLKSLTLGSPDYPIIPIDLRMLLRVQNASKMHLEELIISTSSLSIDVRTLLIGFPSIRHLELPNQVTFTDDAMIEVGAGSIGVFLEDLIIKDADLDLEKLLRMVKARSCAGDKDSKHGIGVTEFKFVIFHCNGAENEVEVEVRDLIEEIILLDVDFNLFFGNGSDGE